MLKTLGKTTWEEIKINEVFACNACWAIFCKTSNDTAILLDICYGGASTWEDPRWSYERRDWVGKTLKRKKDNIWGGEEHLLMDFEDYYKLPKSVQKLFKEE